MNESTIFARHRWPSLAFLVGVGLLLRCWPIHESLWIDELHTAWVVSADWNELISRAMRGNNGPTYFAAVALVTQFWGTHEWTLRLLSGVAGCALIPATYGLVRHWKCSVPASLLASALVAMDRNAIYFSGEARTFALVQLVALIHLFAFSVLLRRWHLPTWIAWMLTAILVFHLHCTSALLFVSETICWLVLVASGKSPVTRPFFFGAALIVVALGMLPAWPLIEQVAQRRANWAMFVSKQSATAMLSIYPLYVYALTPLAAAAIFVRWRNTTQRESSSDGSYSELVLCACWIAIPIAVAWTLTQTDVARLFYRRYVIASSVALAPLTALLITKTTSLRNETVVVVATLAIALVTISPARYVAHGFGALAHTAEEWRTPLETIAAENADTPVILYSGLIETDQWHHSSDEAKREYCKFPVRGIYAIPELHRIIVLPRTKPFSFEESELETLESSGDAWLLIRGSAQSAGTVESQVLAQLGGGWKSTETRPFGRVHLSRVSRARQ